MKVLIVLLLIILEFINASAQQESAYKFGYLFKSSLSQNGKFLKQKIYKVFQTDTIGEFQMNGAPTYITKSDSVEITGYFQLRKIQNRLKGVVTSRSGDTLFLKFWNITSENSKLTSDSSKINSTDNNSKFIYARNKARMISVGQRNSKDYYDLPFRFYQFMATSLPFRVLAKTGTLESEFLNANVSFLYVYGHSRIYRSEFIEPKNRYLAWGPYAGLSAIDDTLTKGKQFGVNYGINGVFGTRGFNITVAYGFQNGFKKNTRETQPYFGFGIGFKLLETFSPEIKRKGDD